MRIGRIVPEPLPPTGPRLCPVLSEQQQQQVFRAAGRCVADTVQSRRRPDAAAAAVAGPHRRSARLWQLRQPQAWRATPRLLRFPRSLGVAGRGGQPCRRPRGADDPRFAPIAAEELGSLKMEVWLLWGLEPVAARGRDRLQAVTIGKHGVQIARGQARGLLLPSVAVNHDLDAKGFLQQVCLKAGLPSDAWLDDHATLMTFEGYAIGGPLRERWPRGWKARRATGAAGRKLLRRRRRRRRRTGRPRWRAVLSRAGRRSTACSMSFSPLGRLKRRAWPAAMVPHAGWMYSGAVAAAVLRRVRIPSRVIDSVAAPPRRRQWAVAPCRRWLIPGGAVPADVDLARQLAGAVKGLRLDARPHAQEHAIEVQLPLLARLASQARVVGITIGSATLPRLCGFAQQLAGVLRGQAEPPLLVISSDMNHFADEARTRRLDRLALDALESLDPARPMKPSSSTRSACAECTPRSLSWRPCGSSAGCTVAWRSATPPAPRSGDTRRVVGYAGLLLGELERPSSGPSPGGRGGAGSGRRFVRQVDADGGRPLDEGPLEVLEAEVGGLLLGPQERALEQIGWKRPLLTR